jgi:uncharacterized alpha-E superfamily protein
MFRDCNVERLASFFQTLRERLAALAPHNRDNPRIVLLTPGPHDATYFEQAYLAQYLGLSLVTGGDLTVREERVLLKTLGGLHPVDVILRRVDDADCDPLELRPESALGVPGLVQAARARNVAIANPPGSGLLQTAAVLAYLPRLCRALLDEDLALPSLRTWWCGDAAAFAEVRARFDALVVRPTFRDAASSPVFTATMTAGERAELLAAITARPMDYVAQEHASPSTTPLIDKGVMTPRTVVLRCYAVSTGRRDYAVMPGGLARVAAAGGGAEVSIQQGANAKDVWVLSTEPVSTFSLLPPASRPLSLSRGGGDLPSRAADNLYWLGRYAERAESIARLARVIRARLADLGGQADLERASEFGAFFAALRAQTEFLVAADIPIDRAPELPRAEALVDAAVKDAQSVGSLVSVVKAAQRAGRAVRDRLSIDTWRVLAALEDETDLNRVVMTLAAFSGLAMESMTRGYSWRFVDMGRRLERAITLITLLRACCVRAIDRERPLLEAVLEIADSGMTYRRRYQASLQTAPVVDLLLTDETNPRSVLYQVRALGEHVRALPVPQASGVRSPQLRLVLGAQSELDVVDVEPLCVTDATHVRHGLDTFLRKLGTILPALSESISDRYLAHATVARHLTDSRGEP